VLTKPLCREKFEKSRNRMGLSTNAHWGGVLDMGAESRRPEPRDRDIGEKQWRIVTLEYESIRICRNHLFEINMCQFSFVSAKIRRGAFL
jgi:hypothetical protein